MTDTPYRIAIVGAGPAGLAAALAAARHGVSYVLLESGPEIAQTLRRFARRKPVMAEPAALPLRSPLPFVAAEREAVLAQWEDAAASLHVRTECRVTGIEGRRPNFRLTLGHGEILQAEAVVLAIGVQGNPRHLGVEGEALPGVQYQLDDPDEYRDETIVVVGGGDAGVENALALARHNRVVLLNRQEEFSSCGEANLARLKDAVTARQMETRVSTTVSRVDAAEGPAPLRLTAQTPQGEETFVCHRVIARLGATPPRPLLERFGIRFASNEANALPQLDDRYETAIAGLHVIGALAGYPLIKQAANQGAEVVAHILGRPVVPADEELLLARLSSIPTVTKVEDGLARVRFALPLLASLSALQVREFVRDSEIHVLRPGEIIFKRNDYSNSFHSLLSGSVQVHVERDDGSTAVFPLGAGDFFGELGLLSGRRRSATVVAGEACVVIETPRRAMLRLLDAAPGVQRHLDTVSLKRVVRNCYGPSLSDEQIDAFIGDALIKRVAAGEVLFREGEAPDALYLIRRGSVTVSRRQNGRDIVLAYVSAGNYVGEMALVSDSPRSATVTAAAPGEVVILEARRFKKLLEQNAEVRSTIATRFLDRLRDNEASGRGKRGEMMQFLVDQGVGEATDVLLIDYQRCIRCDNCERACADAHDGHSRLRRAAGQTFQNLHLPASCRHCEHPRCMKDCPPDAIHRSSQGEIFITDSCIGCGNCGSHCPYGVIQMADTAPAPRRSLWQLIAGRGNDLKPADDCPSLSARHAVKCDMCRGIIGGAACVRACPTGAAFRLSPEEFLAL